MPTIALHHDMQQLSITNKAKLATTSTAHRRRERGFVRVSLTAKELALSENCEAGPELAQIRLFMSTLIEKQILPRQHLASNASPRALANRLERLLFTKASSIAAYRDLRTLQVRCQRLLTVLLQQQSREREQAKALLILRRKKVLIRILGGEEEYQVVYELVQRIPSVARLVQAFHNAPVDRLQTLPWDEMVQECQQQLATPV